MTNYQSALSYRHHTEHGSFWRGEFRRMRSLHDCSFCRLAGISEMDFCRKLIAFTYFIRAFTERSSGVH